MTRRHDLAQRLTIFTSALLLVCWSPASTAQVTFPIKLTTDGRHLEDSAGKPFVIQAVSSWSLLTQLSAKDMETYLEDRRARGFNTVIVTLITHKFTDGAPRNARGVAPFADVANFSMPNDEYFEHAERAIEIALRKGFLVFVAPSYFGYGGGDEGWFQELSNAPEPNMSAYGRYVGNRFKQYPNVAWLLGGDYSPAPGSRGETNAVEIAKGIQTADRPGRLYSYHGGRGTTSLDQAAFRPFINVNAVYTGPADVYQQCQRGNEQGALPTFLIEAWYENEHGMQRLGVRKEAYWATTYCTAGQTLGNAPMWNFGAAAAAGFADNRSLTWQAALQWSASYDQQRLFELLGRVGAYGMVPERNAAVVMAGAGNFGSDTYATTAVKPDRSLSLSYLPVSTTLTIDLAWFRGPVTLRWFDPTNGAFRNAAGPPLANRGTTTVAPPGRNSAGASDWVLVGAAQAAN